MVRHKISAGSGSKAFARVSLAMSGSGKFPPLIPIFQIFSHRIEKKIHRVGSKNTRVKD